MDESWVMELVENELRSKCSIWRRDANNRLVGAIRDPADVNRVRAFFKMGYLDHHTRYERSFVIGEYEVVLRAMNKWTFAANRELFETGYEKTKTLGSGSIVLCVSTNIVPRLR